MQPPDYIIFSDDVSSYPVRMGKAGSPNVTGMSQPVAIPVASADNGRVLVSTSVPFAGSSPGRTADETSPSSSSLPASSQDTCGHVQPRPIGDSVTGCFNPTLDHAFRLFCHRARHPALIRNYPRCLLSPVPWLPCTARVQFNQRNEERLPVCAVSCTDWLCQLDAIGSRQKRLIVLT